MAKYRYIVTYSPPPRKRELTELERRNSGWRNVRRWIWIFIKCYPINCALAIIWLFLGNRMFGASIVAGITAATFYGHGVVALAVLAMAIMIGGVINWFVWKL